MINRNSVKEFGLRRFILKYYDVILSLAFFAAFVAFNFIRVWIACDGKIVYGLDDAYIHLAISEVFARTFQIGINPGDPASTTSSLLYMIILSIFTFKDTLHYYSPLGLNIVGGVLLIIFARQWLLKKNVNEFWRTIALIIMPFLSGVYANMFFGMEHVLHMLITFIYIDAYIASLLTKKKTTLMCIFSSLMVLIRFESILMVVAGSICAILIKNIKKAIINLIPAAGIFLLFMGYSYLNGFGPLPNPSMLKSGLNFELSLSNIVTILVINPITNLMSNIILLELAIFACILLIIGFINKKTIKEFSSISSLVLVLTIYFTSALYETAVYSRQIYYLYFWFFCVFFSEVYVYLKDKQMKYFINELKQFVNELKYLLIKGEAEPIVFRLVVIIGIGLVALPIFFPRAAETLYIPDYGRNIYDQQYHMMEFAKQYYNEDSIALNDIGLVSYGTDSFIIDTFGLGTQTIANYRMNHTFTVDILEDICDQNSVSIAMVYDPNFSGLSNFPASWTLVAEWVMPASENKVLGGLIVNFYAIGEDPNVLKTNLVNFETQLTSRITPVYFI